jgi:DNA-binding NtrC family response regulator
METLHIPVNKSLGTKTQRREIKKILLINEDKDGVLSTVLVREGYDLVHCDSVQKAWSLVYPHRPQLIILRMYKSKDVALADLQECRALAKGIPVVVTIPAHVNYALKKALPHGAASVLAAPSTPESIRQTLHGLEAAMMGR